MKTDNDGCPKEEPTTQTYRKVITTIYIAQSIVHYYHELYNVTSQYKCAKRYWFKYKTT